MPYYSPPPPTHYPPPPPPPPNCNMTMLKPPPPPPPTHHPCYSPPPPPPPPNCNMTMPPQPPPPPCNCTCPPLPYPPPPPPSPYSYSSIAPYPYSSPIYEHHYKALVAVSVSLGGILVAFLLLGAFFLAKMKKKPVIPPTDNSSECDPVPQNGSTIYETIEILQVEGGGPSNESCDPAPITHDHGHPHNYAQSSS